MSKKNEYVYPKGIRGFKPHAKAPDFVLGKMKITLSELNEFCKENKQYLSEYNGKSQITLDVLKGKDGIYFTVDTYKKESKTDDFSDVSDLNDPNQDIPF